MLVLHYMLGLLLYLFSLLLYTYYLYYYDTIMQNSNLHSLALSHSVLHPLFMLNSYNSVSECRSFNSLLVFMI